MVASSHRPGAVRVAAYLAEHAYGNGTLADFMGFMERASGRDLTAWVEAWLLTAGVDVISVDPAEGVVSRRVPQDHPADRPHTLDVAGFDDGAEVFRVPVTVTQERTEVEALRGATAELVVPNAGDLTWATVTLDDRSVGVLDLSRGEVVWTYKDDSALPRTATPRLWCDGGVLVALLGGRHLVRLDVALGQRLWTHPLGLNDLDTALGAVALDPDRLYFTRGKTLVALKTSDGKPAWERSLAGAEAPWSLALAGACVVAAGA